MNLPLCFLAGCVVLLCWCFATLHHLSHLSITGVVTQTSGRNVYHITKRGLLITLDHLVMGLHQRREGEGQKDLLTQQKCWTCLGLRNGTGVFNNISDGFNPLRGPVMVHAGSLEQLTVTATVNSTLTVNFSMMTNTQTYKMKGIPALSVTAGTNITLYHY